MTILHLSDTHGRHHSLGPLPQADVLVHSGDFCNAGSEAEAIDFLNWLCSLPHPHKLFVCGNHDDCLHDATVDGLPADVVALSGGAVTIDGRRFYGVSAFTADQLSGRQSEIIERIPDAVDVIVSHEPPLGILDYADGLRYGSPELLARVGATGPRLHLFGHVHAAYGTATLHATTYSNAALMPDAPGPLRPPRLFSI